MHPFVQIVGIAVLSLAAICAEAADHRVSVGGAAVRFDPPDITINVGDTVTWISESAQPHNVHANDDSFRCAGGCDGDGQGGSGVPRSGPWSSTVAFSHEGVYGYRCDPHAAYGMVGVVRVVAGGGGGGGPAHVPITSGWRSHAEQQRLYDDRGTNPYPVAAPGTSAHERGRAVDVPRSFVARLAAVAPRVGLCHPWPETDPVHFELCRRTP